MTKVVDAITGDSIHRRGDARNNLTKLTVAEKDALILSLLPLVGQLEAALARIAELEARLARLEKPPKTPDNSSLPPSKGQKSSDQPTGSNRPVSTAYRD